MNLSDDWMLQLALKDKKQKGSHFVVEEATDFAGKIDVDLETKFHVEIRNMENARKLRRIAKEKREKGDTA